MKKSIAVILLGSALLLPNNNVEASYSNKAVQVHKVQYINCVEWDGKQYDFKELKKDNYKNHSFHSYWINFAKKYSNITVPEKSAEATNQKEAPEVEQAPKAEEAPAAGEAQAEKTSDVEQTPQAEQPAEKPSAPEAAPAPAVTAPTPEAPSKPVEESTPNASISAIEQEVLNLTNAERQKAGLAPLQIDSKLMDSAREKSRDMSVNNYFSHTSPTYGSPFDQMKSFGISYRAAAENIAMGQRSAQEVVRAWMESPGHRQNILTPGFTHIGIGYDANGNYWTQQFIQK